MPDTAQGLTAGVKRGPFQQNRDIALTKYADVNDTARFVFFEDFVTDTLSTDWWTVTLEADATNKSTCAITEAAYGTAVATLGPVANDFANLASAKQFSSSAPGRFDVRVKVSGAPDNLVIGLSDAKTESNGNLCTNVTSPAIVPDDFVGFIYEKANGGSVWYIGCANNTTDRATALTAAPSSSFQLLSVEWDSAGNATFSIDGVEVGSLSLALRASQTLCLIIAATNIAGTITPSITVDYARVSQERS